MKMNRLLIAACLGLLPLALDAQMLDPALLTRPATDAWPTYNGDYSGRRFSTLTQINQSNVKGLTLEWEHRVTDVPGDGTIVGGKGSEPAPNSCTLACSGSPKPDRRFTAPRPAAYPQFPQNRERKVRIQHDLRACDTAIISFHYGNIMVSSLAT